jgi:N utilization substance protein B
MHPIPRARDSEREPEEIDVKVDRFEGLDKLDRLAGGKSAGEQAPRIPGGIRGARAAALQALYEEDLTGHSAERALERLPVFNKLAPAHASRAVEIVKHVDIHRRELDARIATAAKEFPVEQMGAVERNLLRIALAELDMGEKPPVAVVINEAVELARLFGGESSPKFVHGTLGALLR